MSDLYINLVKKDAARYYKDYLDTVQAVERSGAQFAGRPVPFLYQPMLFGEEDIACFQRAAAVLTGILNKVIKAYLDDAAFRREFGFSELLEELILVDPGYPTAVPMARFDLFYHRPDSFMFCELNADGSSGMNKTNELERIFLQSAPLKDIGEHYQVSFFELIDSWVEASLKNYRCFNPANAAPNVAVVDWLPAGNIEEFTAFRDAYRRRGLAAEIADPRELTYTGGRLWYRSMPVDLIYRRVVTSELIAKADETADFIQAYRDGAVCVVGPLRSEIIHNKIIFQVLHRHAAEILTAEEAAFVKEHIPYTGEFCGDREIYRQVVQSKDEYVLKPTDQYAAAGVYLGKDFTERQWRQTADKCWNSGYLYQRYCPPYRGRLLDFDGGQAAAAEYNHMLGLFVYNEKFAGIYTRVSRHNVIAQNPGYYLQPNFVLTKAD